MNFNTPSNVVQGITVSGDITSNKQWTGTVYITGTVTIKNSKTVTINAGTTVQFNNTAYKLIVESGSLVANGDSNNPVKFQITSGRWNAIEVQGNSYANLTWCSFMSSNNGITLINNQKKTILANCSFNNTGNSYLSLTDSIAYVISTKFENDPFEIQANLSSNLNKINIGDDTSELFIDYFVDVEAENGYSTKLIGINANVKVDQGLNRSENFVGRTDSTGRYMLGHVPALRLYNTHPNVKYDFSYKSSVEVWDSWDGTSKEQIGISRQSFNINNASSMNKDPTTLQIELKFIFDYPPRIDTNFISKIAVKEDRQKLEVFKFHDNDDLINAIQIAPNVFDNITISIKNETGAEIYDLGTGAESGKTRWIKWRPALVSGNPDPELIFYRTIESPNTPSTSDSYRAKVNEFINITITDGRGHSTWTGNVLVEFENVPDKPQISLNPTATVTEDITKYMPISISDDDNATADIKLSFDSPYVTYQKTNSTLVLNFPNEFGGEGAQQLVNVTATDNCYALVDSNLVKNEVTQSFNVIFHQTPDPPVIVGTIPDKMGNETDWNPALDLKDYWSDPDPDEDASTLKWYVTEVDETIFDVSGENVTANTPLVFNLKPGVELGGAKNTVTVEDTITIWLMDKNFLLDSQEIKLKVFPTNLQPSLHKVDKDDKKITVDPENGDSETYFKFQVEYKDLDGEFGDEPDYVHLYVDDNPTPYVMHEMNPNDKNFKDGKKYYYELKLTQGTHTHYFDCSDSQLSARFPDEPNVISLPTVTFKIYIAQFTSSDNNIIARIAYGGSEGLATITTVTDPAVQHDENKGDIGEFFQVKGTDMTQIFWIDFTINFGKDYTNYDSIWLKKDDMELAYLLNNSWVTIDSISKNNQLRCNITPETSLGYDKLLENILSSDKIPTFTIIGWLDADGDGYVNDEDAFPFDPAARYDRDGDGSPGETEWVPGKSAKDSTSVPPLHEDKFPDDPAASVNNDNDECPDEWNPGKSQADSTSVPPLNLDMFPDNPDACLDTDGDNQPDGDFFNSQPWMDKDDDNDMMPDSWENKWNDYAIKNDIDKRFNTKDPSDGKQDWDGDGRNNTQEYLDNTNPFEKDSEGESPIPEGLLIYIILIVIVIVIVILALALVMRKRKKEGAEELPRGMGGAPPPEEPLPPPVTPAPEGEVEGEGEGAYPEQYEQYPEGEMPDQVEGLEQEPAGDALSEESYEGTTTTEMPETSEGLDVVQDAQVGESIEESSAGTESEIQSEGTQELQYTCPNCNTPVTPDMPACPGCQTPLTFE